MPSATAITISLIEISSLCVGFTVYNLMARG
jgi:hypothetical protein